MFKLFGDSDDDSDEDNKINKGNPRKGQTKAGNQTKTNNSRQPVNTYNSRQNNQQKKSTSSFFSEDGNTDEDDLKKKGKDSPKGIKKKENLQKGKKGWTAEPEDEDEYYEDYEELESDQDALFSRDTRKMSKSDQQLNKKNPQQSDLLGRNKFGKNSDNRPKLNKFSDDDDSEDDNFFKGKKKSSKFGQKGQKIPFELKIVIKSPNNKKKIIRQTIEITDSEGDDQDDQKKRRPSKLSSKDNASDFSRYLRTDQKPKPEDRQFNRSKSTQSLTENPRSLTPYEKMQRRKSYDISRSNSVGLRNNKQAGRGYNNRRDDNNHAFKAFNGY